MEYSLRICWEKTPLCAPVHAFLVRVCGAKQAYEMALDHECGEKLVGKYKKRREKKL